MVVVGGGILGASTAAHLGRLGASVVLVTDGGLGSGASGRSLSWLNSFAPRSPDYHRLRLAGLDRYRQFLAQRDAGHYLRFDGGLSWTNSQDTDGHRQTFAHLTEIGYPAEWLGPDEVGRRVPGVNPAAIPRAGAIFTPAEGWVDLPSLIGVLASDVVSQGGRVLVDAGSASVTVRGDRVASVSLGSGEVLPADAVVLATGARVPDTVAKLGITIPDATSTALLLRSKSLGTALRAVLNTPRVSVRPVPSGGLVLDADWASQTVRTAPAGHVDVDPEVVAELLHEASAVLAGTPPLELDSYGVGPKPAPGDGEPVLGELEEIPGYYVAFTHSGATLGLIAGELLAREVVSGQQSELLGPFRPSRFRPS